LPGRLADLGSRHERVTRLPADVGAVGRFVAEVSRVTAGAAA
jgi:hypothetical protein